MLSIDQSLQMLKQYAIGNIHMNNNSNVTDETKINNINNDNDIDMSDHVNIRIEAKMKPLNHLQLNIVKEHLNKPKNEIVAKHSKSSLEITVKDLIGNIKIRRMVK